MRRSRRGAVGLLSGGLLGLFVLGCARPSAEPKARSGPPQRIVSQVVDSDEILHALGPEVRARVAGVSIMADDPRYSTIAGLWPASTPRLPGVAESLIAAEPDLVILASFSAPQTRALLEGSGIETVILEGFDGFDDYEKRVRTIAKTVGASEAADDIIASFRAKLPPPQADQDRTVMSYVAGNVAGAGTTFDDVCTAAGLRNIAAANGIEGHKPVSIEQIVVWDPDFVVIECASDCDAAVANVRKTAGLSSLAAARNGRIVAIESRRLLSSGAAMAEVAAELRQAAESR